MESEALEYRSTRILTLDDLKNPGPRHRKGPPSAPKALLEERDLVKVRVDEVLGQLVVLCEASDARHL